jgi:hypothetical protein
MEVPYIYTSDSGVVHRSLHAGVLLRVNTVKGPSQDEVTCPSQLQVEPQLDRLADGVDGIQK